MLGAIKRVLSSERGVVIKKKKKKLAIAAGVRCGMSQNRLPEPSGSVIQGVSFHYLLWWLQAPEEDKTCLMQFLLKKQESQCNPSKIVFLSIARVINPEAPRITTSFIQLRMQLAHFLSGVKSKKELCHHCFLLMNIPQTCH